MKPRTVPTAWETAVTMKGSQLDENELMSNAADVYDKKDNVDDDETEMQRRA